MTISGRNSIKKIENFYNRLRKNFFSRNIGGTCFENKRNIKKTKGGLLMHKKMVIFLEKVGARAGKNGGTSWKKWGHSIFVPPFFPS